MVNCLEVFPTSFNSINSLLIITLNFTPIHVYPRLKTNILCYTNMLVLRTSNFQGATIRPIVSRHKHSLTIRPVARKGYGLIAHGAKPGAHHYEPATTPYSCHGVLTDRTIFSLNLLRIKIPTGASLTNCHNADISKWCRDVHVRPHCYILLRRARVHWNRPIPRKKYLKIDWSVKLLLHKLITGAAGSQ